MITIERWARGAVLALAATLAFASVGCQQATDSESDDEESVAAAGQELDPADGEDDQSQGGVVLPGADCQAGDENKDPQPQPWRNGSSNSSSKPGPDPVDPSTHTSVVSPSTGHR